VAFHWRVLYQLWDEESDRFWYATYDVERDDPISRQSVIRDVRSQVNAQLSGANYEALVQWVDQNFSRPTYTVTAIWQD
jgi:hypothetical protein